MRFRFSAPLLAFGIVAATLLAAPASAQLITNGSFESPSLGNGPTYGLFDTFNGWTALKAGAYPGQIEIQHENIAGTTPYGEQFLELDSNSSSYVYQNVATITNQTYQVTFSFSRRPNVANNGFGYQAVGGGNAILFTNTVAVLNSPPLPTTTSWSDYTYTFTANSNSTRIAFFNANPSDSLGAYIDNVSMTAVPEPGEYAVAAMMMGGIGLGMLRGRLRQRKAA